MFKDFEVLGQKLIASNNHEVIEELERYVHSGKGGYVCVTNVHTIVEARIRPEFGRVMKESTLRLPDGVPLTWLGLLKGEHCQRIAGPDLMKRWVFLQKDTNVRHFLLGGTASCLNQLAARISKEACNIQNVVGYWSPPFGPVSDELIVEARRRIQEARANVIWVGLGAPKQEIFMHCISKMLPNVLFIGVGAAFDFLAGSKKRAPVILQKMGLEWFWRLMQDPRRLLRRYLKTNSLFLMFAVQELSKFYFHKISLRLR